MDGLIPTPVAHTTMISSHQQTKHVGSSKLPISRQNENSGAVDLRGDFRKQPGQLFLRNGSSVEGRGRSKHRSGVNVSAIDATQPFDFESMRSQELEKSTQLKVGIVGFGNFGQFLAERIVNKGHKVLAHSRRDYSEKARALGVSFFRDPDDFCEEHPEVVLLCTSILSTEAVLQSLPLQRLKRHTLFVDVLSVKEFPKNLFHQVLPPEFDILCTHPMFGPESGKGSWVGLPFVFDKVRISNGRRSRVADRFLDIFSKEGCRMVEMSCAEHDRFAAGSQFVTHTVGRVLGKLGLDSTPINTKGYETLLGLVQNTSNDSFELYHGLFMYNPNATEELERLEIAFDSVKRQLFGQLHDVFRKQLFNDSSAPRASLPPDSADLSKNGSSQSRTPSNGVSRVTNNTDIVPSSNGVSRIAKSTDTDTSSIESELRKTIELNKDSYSVSKVLN